MANSEKKVRLLRVSVYHGRVTTYHKRDPVSGPSVVLSTYAVSKRQQNYNSRSLVACRINDSIQFD